MRPSSVGRWCSTATATVAWTASEYVGRRVWARWDGHVVRIFNQRLEQIAIHAQREPGRFATDDRHIVAEKRGGIERGTAWWLRKARRIGPGAGRWAEAMLQQRGIPGVRVLMGLVSLTNKHTDVAIEQACHVAQSHGAYRLRVIRELLKRQAPEQEQFEFIAEHPLIRSLSDYGQLVHDTCRDMFEFVRAIGRSPHKNHREDSRTSAGFSQEAPLRRDDAVLVTTARSGQ